MLYLREAFSVRLDPGAHATLGRALLRNSADEPAIVDDVSLADATPGLELVEAYVVRVSDRSTGVTMAAQFPPEGWESVPLNRIPGATVMHYDGTDATDNWLLLRLAVPDGQGVYEFDGILLDYHVGEARFQMQIPYTARICTPSDAWQSCGFGDSTPVPASPP